MSGAREAGDWSTETWHATLDGATEAACDTLAFMTIGGNPSVTWVLHSEAQQPVAA